MFKKKLFIVPKLNALFRQFFPPQDAAGNMGWNWMRKIQASNSALAHISYHLCTIVSDSVSLWENILYSLQE